jgi:hypothetical protein
MGRDSNPRYSAVKATLKIQRLGQRRCRKDTTLIDVIGRNGLPFWGAGRQGSTNGFMLCSECDFGILTAAIGQQISRTSEIVIIDLQLNVTD